SAMPSPLTASFAMSEPKRNASGAFRCWSRTTTAPGRTKPWDGYGGQMRSPGDPPMRIHEWQVRGPDRSVRSFPPEIPPTIVGHGILADAMFYLTARRAEDGMLFRVS